MTSWVEVAGMVRLECRHCEWDRQEIRETAYEAFVALTDDFAEHVGVHEAEGVSPIEIRVQMWKSGR